MKIISDGTPEGTKVINDDGTEVQDVESIEINCSPVTPKRVQARITVTAPRVEVEVSHPEIIASCPHCGDIKIIARRY